MDFFSLPHQNQPFVTEGEDGATDLFAKAVDDRYNTVTGAPIPTSFNNSRVTPLSLSLPPIPRHSHLPSPHLPTRPHPHHLPASSASASLFTVVSPTDLPEILSDPQTLILDIRPLPTYGVSRIPNAVPLSVPSTLLKRPLFSTEKLAEMLPNKVARRKFSQWRLAKRILVYDTDSIVLPDNSNILGLLRKFRAEAGLSTDPQSSGVASSSSELRLSWLKGGFQAVLRERQSLLDLNQVTDDDDEDTPSPPPFPDSGYLGSAEHPNPTDPSTSRSTLLRTKHLPMSAFTASSTTSQRSGPVHHKLYLGHQTATRDLSATSGPVPSSRTEFVIRPSLSGVATVPQSSDPGRSVAYNPFYDTIRQNVELSHGITERISLKISRITKDRVDELPFMWLRELGRWAGADEELSDAEEDHIEGMSGSGSGSGMSGEDHSDSSSDSGDDSGSGREYTGAYGRMNPPALAPALPPTTASAMMPEDPQAEGSEALAMQFYRIELGEQRRLMGIMAHHSRESGRVLDGETRSSKSKKRSKLRSKGLGRPSRGKHGSREFPYSITAGVEKGAKNRYRNIWPFEHARVRLQKHRPKQRSIGKPPTPPSYNSNPGTLHPLTLPQPSDFLPPVTLSLSSSRSIQLPLHTPAMPSSTDDYVNASYVQPLGTKKRYIATQGPLPETFNDFWLLVWEQNVHVIVMLTREVEGSTVKCGNYWSDERFGPFRLKILESTGAVDEYDKSDRRAPGDFSFPFMYKERTESTESSNSGSDSHSTVKRVLELSHTGFSHLPPRRIVQFQYLDWPDLNVPSDTIGVLKLIREVEREVEISEESRGVWEGPRRPDDWRGRTIVGTVRPRRSTIRTSRDASPSGTGSGSGGSGTSSPNLDSIDSDSGITKRALGERPVLLHCSAGVGRTGGFIAIDAVLDGVRREMRKRRSGPQVGTRGGRDISVRIGRTSGSSTSEKDRSSSSDEVAAMDVDEASAGGSAPPVPGLVMKLAAVDHKAVLHVPVVGVISPSSTKPSGKVGTRSYSTPMDLDLATSPWTAIDSQNKLQTWRGHPSEPLSSPSSLSVQESRLATASGESVTSAVPQALSRSLSPSDSAQSDISALSIPLSVHRSSSPRGFSPIGPERSRMFSTAPSGIPMTTPLVSARSAVLSPPFMPFMPAVEIAQPIAKRASGSSLPPDTEVTSDSSRGRSTGASSLSGMKSGSPETLPTDPSVMDLSSATKTDLENSGLRLPLPAFSGILSRNSGSKSSSSPPGNEDSPPNNSDPYYSQSQSQSEQHSPPAFDYTTPRQLHDYRHSPILLSTLDEPIHRVIEDMREQRMSLCQSLRQYVFVHRAVIEGVLILVDEERRLYGGQTWKDTDLDDLSKLVSARLPTAPTESCESGDAGGSRLTSGARSGSSGAEESKSSLLSSQGKRRASPTELPKEDRRGDMRMSKRPSIKRAQRSSDDSSCGDAVPAPRRAGIVLPHIR